MSSKIRVHEVRVGTLTASIYGEETRETAFSLTQSRETALADFPLEQPGHARKALQQAEYFIRLEQQTAQKLRFPGCG